MLAKIQLENAPVGYTFAVLTLAVVWITIAFFRFEWLQRYVPFLLKWGRGPWTFPASRVGMTAAGFVLFALALSGLNAHLKWLHPLTGPVLILSSLGVALVAGVHDFRLHRRNRK